MGGGGSGGSPSSIGQNTSFLFEGKINWQLFYSFKLRWFEGRSHFIDPFSGECEDMGRGQVDVIFVFSGSRKLEVIILTVHV